MTLLLSRSAKGKISEWQGLQIQEEVKDLSDLNKVGIFTHVKWKENLHMEQDKDALWKQLPLHLLHEFFLHLSQIQVAELCPQ